jgi:hypothetical protein
MNTETQETNQRALMLPVSRNRVAVIPHPMEEDEYELLIATLNIWKKRVVEKTQTAASPKQ